VIIERQQTRPQNAPNFEPRRAAGSDGYAQNKRNFFSHHKPLAYSTQQLISVYIKIVRLISDVGDRTYAISYAAADACTAAGCRAC